MDASAWPLVFRYLCLEDLVSCQRSCSKVAAFVDSYVSIRKQDAAEGLEKFVVPYQNTVDYCPYAEVHFVNQNVLKGGVPVREAYRALNNAQKGCKCSVPIFDNEGETGSASYMLEKEIACIRAANQDTGKSDLQIEWSRGRNSRCKLSNCSCGVDLSNETAYGENGLLLALLKPLSDHLVVQHAKAPAPQLCNNSSQLSAAHCSPVQFERPERSQGNRNGKELPNGASSAETPQKKQRVSHPENSSVRSSLTQHQGTSSGPELCRNESGRCLETDVEAASLVVFECGPACGCSIECPNRCTQQGLAVQVRVVRHAQKGWCLHAAENISQGAFICQYAGELLTNSEADQRHRIYDSLEYRSSSHPPPALLVVREHLPSRTATLRLNIDATNYGNVARFVNHSCDGGNATRVLIRQMGWPLPHVALFANRTVRAGEEITMSYGEVDANAEAWKRAPPCLCGSLNCTGRMPRDLVGA